MKKKSLYFLFLILLSSYMVGQVNLDLLEQLKSIKNQSGSSKIGSTGLTGTTMFKDIEGISEENYILDAGDYLYAKIDIEGPEVNEVDIPLSENGYGILPQGESILLKGLTLKVAKDKIKNKLELLYPNAIIEVFLKEPRSVSLHISLFGLKNYSIKLKANISPFEIYNSIPVDTTGLLDSVLSKRFINVFREDKTIILDMYKEYFYQNNKTFQFQTGDRVYLPAKDYNKSMIYIAGAVKVPGYYEYASGDRLKDLLTFAGGLSNSADSTNIELFRYVDYRLEQVKLRIPEDRNYSLLPGDRIFIRFNPTFTYDWKVEIVGEVLLPGEYSIIDNQTTLYELIEKAGGFTDRASLVDALVIRNKFVPQDRELNRLRRMTVEEMNKIEKSYFRLRSRENAKKVSVNFVKLFKENKMDEDITLRDEDQVIIPSKNDIVILSGGIIRPGILNYTEGKTYKDYIQLAGGFNKRARKGDIQIIKSKTGVWLEASEKVKIEPGDIIFIPEKEERDYWEIFKESLLILTQLSTIALVIANIKK